MLCAAYVGAFLGCVIFLAALWVVLKRGQE